ncbi:MAG: signal peptide peptidase SppA [Burkholderiaceae bacterium]|nr:signal peptide peptidase SppA [Burkholderiaceae bacterium]
MSSSRFAPVGRFFGRLWWLLDASRRTLLNLLFLALLGLLIYGLVSRGPARLEEKTALVLNLGGTVVEQYSGNARDNLLNQAKGRETNETQLRDVLAGLEAAAKDDKISSLVLALDDFQGAGLSTLREMAGAIARFKAGGKPVFAWGSSFDQRSYFLAAQASEVWLHPMGMLMIEGFGRPRTYYRDALDKLGLSANVLRVGSFKNFGEVYSANGPSKETTEADRYLYDALWKTYTDEVEKARKLPEGSIMKGINSLPEQLAAVGGDAAKLALNAKLVDALKTRDEMRALLSERGAKDEANKTFRQINLGAYLSHVKPKFTGDAVGVVIAQGGISDGVAPSGSIGGRSTAELIRKARDDDKIKAIVLRVDSPGGSAFGSELVRRELELTRAAGKPVVVSMGNVAASGGYWISMAADEVIASPATITGSIGVFAMLPSADKALDKLGVHTGGYTTTWLAGVYDPRRALDPRFASLVQSSIEHIYADFTGKAAQARKTTPEKINEVAQGRVWTGAQAKERGLVDTLGSYGDALKSAATRGKLKDDYRVVYIERERGRVERLLDMLGGTAADVVVGQIEHKLGGVGVPAALTREVQKDFAWLGELSEGRKAFGAVAHCFCAAP